MPALSEEEKTAFHAIRRRLSKCPAWCFCNTKKWKKILYTPIVGEKKEKYRQIRRFSLNPICPLIAHLCPDNFNFTNDSISPSTSLYMTTIEGTRFCDVIHELEVVDE